MIVCNSASDAGREAALPRPARRAAGAGRADHPDGRLSPRLDAFRRRGIPARARRPRRGRHRTSARSPSTTSSAGAWPPSTSSSAGHRRIAFVGGPPACRRSQRPARRRAAAVREACGSDDALTVLPPAQPHRGRRPGRRPRGSPACRPAVGPPRSSAPTTCSRSACSRRWSGTASRVPDDIAIVGYDDIEFAAAAAVPLTSVRQPRYELGRRGRRTAAGGGVRPPTTSTSSPCSSRSSIVRESSMVRRPGGQRRGRAMKVALFATCLVDTMVPQVGRATAGCSSGSGTRSSSRRGRPAAGRCTSTPATAARPCRSSPTTCAPSPAPRRSSRRPDRASPRSTTSRPPSPGGPASTRWPTRPRRWPGAPTSCPSSWSTSSASPTSAPTTRTGSPTTRPATRCGCCGSATGRCSCCARSGGWTSWSCPPPTSAAASAARSR